MREKITTRDLKNRYKSYLSDKFPNLKQNSINTMIYNTLYPRKYYKGDFLMASWDEFGISEICLCLYYYFQENGEDHPGSKVSTYRRALITFSEYLQSEYSNYSDLPILLEESNSSTENTVERISVTTHDAVCLNQDFEEKKEVEKAKTKTISHHSFQNDSTHISYERRDLKSSSECDLLDYCRTMKMVASYKPILIKAIVYLVSTKEIIKIKDIVLFFRKYYINRFLSKGIMEKKNSVFSSLQYKYDDAKRIIVSNPLRILSELGYLQYDSKSEIITLENKTYVHVLGNVKAIVDECNNRLDTYYDNLPESEKNIYSLFRYSSNNGNTLYGITRSFCRNRQGKNSTLHIEKKDLSFQDAIRILQEHKRTNSIQSYRNNPLHVLLFENASGRLINAYSSFEEAGCLLGIDWKKIKGMCCGYIHPDKYKFCFDRDYKFDPKFDEKIPRKVCVGMKVRNKQYGEGIIRAIYNDIIDIEFSDRFVKYQIPYAFEKRFIE